MEGTTVLTLLSHYIMLTHTNQLPLHNAHVSCTYCMLMVLIPPKSMVYSCNMYCMLVLSLSLSLSFSLSISLSYTHMRTHHSQQHHIGDTPQSSSILQRDSLGNEVPVRKELHPQRPSCQEHTSVPGKDLQGMKCG